jgi:hypothetical protein
LIYVLLKGLAAASGLCASVSFISGLALVYPFSFMRWIMRVKRRMEMSLPSVQDWFQ